MTNGYYNSSGAPAYLSRGSSATIDTEYDSVEDGFDKLPTLNQIYGGSANFVADTGVVNAAVAVLSTNLSALYEGLEVVVKMVATNTGATTMAVTGVSAFGAKSVFRYDGSALQAADLVIGSYATFRYSVALGAFLMTQQVSTSPTSGLPTSGGTMTGQLRFAKGTAVVAAATVNLDTAGGNDFHMTGNTTITAFTIASGQLLKVVVDGAPLITYNATTLKMPGAASIQAAAGDTFWIMGDGSGNAIITDYTKASGLATVVVAPTPPALVFLAAVTPTAAANVDFLNTFASTYDEYLIVGTGIDPSATDSLLLRLAVGGAADSGSNYATSGAAPGAATSLSIVASVDPANEVSFQLTVYNCNSALNKATMWQETHKQNGGAVQGGIGIGLYTNASSVTGFRLYWAGASNFVAKGRVKVYGITKQ
jgi:hypothetical protein